MTNSATSVRTRYAPSPTGYLHIGALRTVIFSWLFAQHEGGQFLLRIEDTDRTRLVADSESQLKDALLRMDIAWHEGPDVGGPHAPYVQSERLDLYHRHADELLKQGHLYKCYCTSDRLAALAKAQEESGQAARGYDRHCRYLTADEKQALDAAGTPYTLRLAVPLTGKTVVADLLRGDVEFDHENVKDLVMIKSDGFPTYHFAVVVDDHDMRISHVLRGDEWLPTAPIHVLLYQLLGWSQPVWVHVPPVKGKDGKKKLSKRDGDTSLTEYLDKGYLPDALINFLALVGWSPGGNREIMSREELIRDFDITRIGLSGGVFDVEKLNHFNQHYISLFSDEELVGRLAPFLSRDQLVSADGLTEPQKQMLVKLAPHVRERLVVLSDCLPLLRPFFIKPAVDVKLLTAQLKKDNGATALVLSQVRQCLNGLADFQSATIETALRQLADELSLGGKLFMLSRVALTGEKVSLPLFESMSALGKDEVLARLNTAAELL